MTSGGRPAGQDEPGRSQRPGEHSPGEHSPSERSAGERGPGEQNAGWSVFSYLISGMAVYGAIGWLVGHWTHLPLLFPLGMLAGLGVAILLIVLKYGRS
jgi:F0F1-type ATP synthase assembly protein I